MYIFSLKYRHCLYFYGARKPPKRWRRCPDLAGCAAVGVASGSSGPLLAVPDRRLFRSSRLACSASYLVAWRTVARLLAPCIHGARLRLPACCACRSGDGVRSLRTYNNRCVRVFAFLGLYIIYNNTAVIFNKRQRYFMCSFNKSKKHDKKGLTVAKKYAILWTQKKTIAKQKRGCKNVLRN